MEKALLEIPPIHIHPSVYGKLTVSLGFAQFSCDMEVRECLGNRNGNWPGTVYQSSLLSQGIILVLGLNRF